MIDEAAILLRWGVVGSRLDERGRRLFAAVEVRTAGRGGLAMVSKITGLARSTINRGKQDIDTQPLPKGRVRRAGGGRRSVCENEGFFSKLARSVLRHIRVASKQELKDRIMAAIDMSGSMSGDGKRSDCRMAQATASILDSTRSIPG